MKGFGYGAFVAWCIFVGLFIGNLNAEKRPSIEVWEINTAPAVFFEAHKEIMLPAESVIFKAYQAKTNSKWTTRYRYAYVLRKQNKFFSKTEYLKFHPADAVDREVIFSNQMADPQLFIILPTAAQHR
jgi:hypothetical protein